LNYTTPGGMIMADKNGTMMITVGWVLVALFGLLQFGPFVMPWPTSTPMFHIVPMVLFSVVHGSVRYGWLKMLAAVAICFVLGIALENLSMVTGFPFGYFQWPTDLFGPKIGGVPSGVGIGYFMQAYMGWTIANLLLDEADVDGKAFSVFALPIVGAFIPMAMNATGDPLGSTLRGMWLWVAGSGPFGGPGGGGYFGVPLSNSLGLMLTNYLGLQIFALYLAKHRSAVRTGQPTAWWLQPLALLAMNAVMPMLLMKVGPDGTGTDPSGYVWHARHIYEGLAVASLVGTTFLTVLGTIVAFRRNRV
jgi:uncharacterized membrane protein